MTANHLHRELAPISDKAWATIEAEATRTLRHFLAGRPLVDLAGPIGWTHSAASRGRVDPELPSPADGVQAAARRVQPLIELRVPFELDRDEIDAIDRGAPDPELAPVIDAARRAALAEDRLVFDGSGEAAIAGVVPSSPYEPLPIGDDYDKYPGVVASAVAVLRQAGVGGPYAVALGPRCYTGVIETTEHGGYPVLEHVQLILGGPVVWAPAVDGAVVLSRRGGDYTLVCGQDFSIGYDSHSEDNVALYLEESVTFQVCDDRAAIALRYAD